MDAQAQDRCHRIGQTRDVHIYRLVSEKTIEENILKKANQKRLLADMTIEGGCFTTALLKKHHITELFDEPEPVLPSESESVAVSKAVTSKPFDSTTEAQLEVTVENLPATTATGKTISPKDVSQFEAVLELVEDESDVLATKELKAEVKADIAEFDENDLTGANNDPDSSLADNRKSDELNKIEMEFNAIETEVCSLLLFFPLNFYMHFLLMFV